MVPERVRRVLGGSCVGCRPFVFQEGTPSFLGTPLPAILCTSPTDRKDTPCEF